MQSLNTTLLSKKIFNFKKSFEYMEELEGVEGPDGLSKKKLNIEVDLVIDLIEDQFYIDFTNPFKTDTGIISFFGPNIMGNKRIKAKISAEYYHWIAEIVEFAEKELTSLTIQYDILKDGKVIDIVFKFKDFFEESNFEKSFPKSSPEEIWDQFKRYLNPKRKKLLKQSHDRDYDDERFDLDDNK